MTSVAFEASAVSPRPMKTERASKPTGLRGDGAFAALVENESRPGPDRTDRPSDNPQTRDAAKPVEREDAVSPDAAPQANEADRQAPAETAKDETAAGEASDTTITIALESGAPVPPVVAQEAAAPVEPATAVVAAPVSLQTVPEAATPATTDAMEPATAAHAPIPAAPDKATPAAPTADVAGQTQGKPETAAAPQLKLAPAPDAEKPEETAQAETAETVPEQSAEAMADDAAPRPAKAAPEQTAATRPASAPDKPDARPETAVKPDDPALAAKPAADPSSQTAQPTTPAPAQAAPAHTASTQTATPLSTPVSAAQPVPVNAIAVEIAAQARAGSSRFEIRLDPPELGRIDVRLDIDRDGNVSSRLVIERADTYDLLRRDQSTLERALQQAGLKTSGESLEFSLRDQGFAQQRNAEDNLPRGTRGMIQDTEVPPAEAAQGYARLIGGRGGVDIRV